jgi:lysosomal alpha-mannosidase
VRGTTAANTVVGDQTLTNGVVTITVSGTTGLVTTYANALTGVNQPLANSFYWYNASIGNAEDGQPSGAYIFRPNSSTPFAVTTAAVTVTLVTGPVVNEARQVFTSWASQVVRLWANASFADFEYTIGPIEFADGWGKEIIARYDTSLATNATWYTDANGRDMQTRIRNYRPTWTLNLTEPVASNYFPVNTAIATADVNTGLNLWVANDRSQGGSSMADGSLELMVHRRLLHDDYRGVGEPLNETGLDGDGLIVRGIHRLAIDPATVAPTARRTAVQNQMFRPLHAYAPLAAGVSPAKWISSYVPRLTGLSAPLPANVHLLTAQSYGTGKLLVRLAHLYAVGEGAANAANATVGLASLFAGLTITSAVETTLTANQPLAAVKLIPVTGVDGITRTGPVVPTPPAGAALSVTLGPLQIRTFICSVTYAGQDAVAAAAEL